MSSCRWSVVVPCVLAVFLTFADTFDHADWAQTIQGPNDASTAIGTDSGGNEDHLAMRAEIMEGDEKHDPALGPERPTFSSFNTEALSLAAQRRWQDYTASRTRTPS